MHWCSFCGCYHSSVSCYYQGGKSDGPYPEAIPAEPAEQIVEIRITGEWFEWFSFSVGAACGGIVVGLVWFFV